MADATNKRLNIYIDQASAELALQTLQKKADKLTESIDKGKTAGKTMTAELKRLSEVESSIKGVQSQIDKGLAPSIRQQTTLVTKLRNELKSFTGSATDLQKLSNEYQKQTALLKKLEEQTLGVSRAQSGITKESSAFGKLGLAGGVALGNLYTKAASIAVDAGRHFISVNAQFEKSVANLSAITGATGKDLEFLKNSAINLSATTTRSAVDYVEAMKLIASAKPELLANKEALLEVTKAASLLADASGLELPDASKRLTDALNQFGAPASQAAKYVDALAAAAKYGAAEVPDVTDALLQFGSQAKSSNISIYESAAAIEVLAEKGIKGAEAGTKLRNVFLAMNAVDGLDKKALDSLEKAGVNTAILSDKTLSLETRLKEFSKIQGDATALVNVFGKENFNAGQIVLQNIPRFAELAKQTKEVGVAHQQATVNTDTLQDAWKRLGNIADAEFLTNGGAFTGFLKSIVNFGSKALTTLGSVFTMGKALATFDFGVFGRINKEVAKNKEATATNTKINTIIDVYTQQEAGKADASQRILKRLQQNVDSDYKAFAAARAKGDKEAAGKAFTDLQLAGKTLKKFRADQATIAPPPPPPPPPPKDTSASKGSSFDSKSAQELKEKLAALRAETLIPFFKKANLEAVTFSQPIKPELSIQNPDKVLEDGINLVDKILTDVAKTNRTAGLQLDVLKFGLNNRKGIDAQKKLLDEQMQQELSVAYLTENEIALIKERYKQADAQLDTNKFEAKLGAIQGFANQAISIFNTIAQAQNARENAALNADIKRNDKRRKAIQDLQKNKVITEIEARKRISELDTSDQKKKDELEKKQFERNKRIALGTALVNGALAITSVLAAKPGVTDILSLATFRAINIALTVATTAAQIATIAGSKFAKGGKLTGPSHSAGGMPVINPTTGAKEAEVEGGEYILSRATVANNRSLADMLLNTSMNNNGARISLPQWQSRQYRPVDYSGISQSASKLRFASGGVLPGASSGTQQATDPMLIETLQQTQQLLAVVMQTNQSLQQQLKQPIKGDWSLKQLDDARLLQSNILSEANP